MFKEILAVVNWADILAIGIFVRCIYIGAKNGLMVEAFKFFGMLFATFVTVHYYVRFSELLSEHIMASATVNEILAFLLLWIGTVAVFKIVSEGYMLVSKAGQKTYVSQIGSVILAFARAILICGLAFLLMYVSGNKYVIEKVKTSWAGDSLVQVSPNVYRTSYDGFVSKFFPGEKENTKVFTLLKGRKKDK